jgi:hypothetical protein
MFDREFGDDARALVLVSLITVTAAKVASLRQPVADVQVG